jgi:hypothetical protein
MATDIVDDYMALAGALGPSITEGQYTGDSITSISTAEDDDQAIFVTSDAV